jgi:hypothetical protein
LSLHKTLSSRPESSQPHREDAVERPPNFARAATTLVILSGAQRSRRACPERSRTGPLYFRRQCNRKACSQPASPILYLSLLLWLCSCFYLGFGSCFCFSCCHSRRESASRPSSQNSVISTGVFRSLTAKTQWRDPGISTPQPPVSHPERNRKSLSRAKPNAGPYISDANAKHKTPALNRRPSCFCIRFALAFLSFPQRICVLPLRKLPRVKAAHRYLHPTCCLATTTLAPKLLRRHTNLLRKRERRPNH